MATMFKKSDVLGITLNKKIENMWALNLDEKFVKVENMLNSW